MRNAPTAWGQYLETNAEGASYMRPLLALTSSHRSYWQAFREVSKGVCVFVAVKRKQVRDSMFLSFVPSMDGSVKGIDAAETILANPTQMPGRFLGASYEGLGFLRCIDPSLRSVDKECDPKGRAAPRCQPNDTKALPPPPTTSCHSFSLLFRVDSTLAEHVFSGSKYHTELCGTSREDESTHLYAIARMTAVAGKPTLSYSSNILYDVSGRRVFAFQRPFKKSATRRPWSAFYIRSIHPAAVAPHPPRCIGPAKPPTCRDRALANCTPHLILDPIDRIVAGNRLFAAKTSEANPNAFADLTKGQWPEILWIGCADSRIPETTVCGSLPGEIFVSVLTLAGKIVETFTESVRCTETLQTACIRTMSVPRA